MSIDLSKVSANESEVELNIPGFGPIGFHVTLRHESSTEVQDFVKRYQKRVLDDTRKGGKNQAANAEFYKLEKPLAHIAGWRWSNENFNFNGAQPSFSREAAVEMLKGAGAFSHYLRKLIDDETADDENFLVKSA